MHGKRSRRLDSDRIGGKLGWRQRYPGVLGPRTPSVQARLHRHRPKCDARGPATVPSQLTADREKTRMEIMVRAAAHTATTARLSHASVATLLIPQMSCRPLPDGSMKP